MLITMSAALLLGLLIWFLLRIHYLRWPHTLLAATFGFLLATTAAAPTVQSALDGVAGFISQFRF
ncbi:hypothetical protein ACWDR0_14705 [Streptomyces sp. NPDC003691]|uniref:hypothetical protein n=1 Tax=Streptomyces TaxID=1883 RepID=UPI00367382D1